MRTPRILIVSASAGSGHVRAGLALEEAFRDRGDVRAEHVDLLELAPRWVRAAYGGGFELIASHTPRIWKQIYRRTDAPDPDEARWGPLAHRLLFRAFRKLILGERWDACVATHFLPGQLAAGTVGAPPFSMVITDLTLHHYWAQPRVSRFFVGCEELAAELEPRVSGRPIDSFGIPISKRFANAPDRAAARNALGLHASSPIAVIVGGGLGIGVDRVTESALSSSVPGMQIVAICGRNRIAHDRLTSQGVGEDRLKVVGYVPDIERYFAASDLVLTKPGGLTTSEVLAVGRPLILTDPIPGQEEGNARVLCAAGAAVAPSTLQELPDILDKLFRDPNEIARLTGGARSRARPLAAPGIAAAVCADALHEAAA